MLCHGVLKGSSGLSACESAMISRPPGSGVSLPAVAAVAVAACLRRRGRGRVRPRRRSGMRSPPARLRRSCSRSLPLRREPLWGQPHPGCRRTPRGSPPPAAPAVPPTDAARRAPVLLTRMTVCSSFASPSMTVHIKPRTPHFHPRTPNLEPRRLTRIHWRPRHAVSAIAARAISPITCSRGMCIGVIFGVDGDDEPPIRPHEESGLVADAARRARLAAPSGFYSRAAWTAADSARCGGGSAVFRASSVIDSHDAADAARPSRIAAIALT